MKRLDENGKITIFFDASKYEYSEPAAALFYTIATTLGKTKKNVSSETRKIAEVALDIFVRRYTGISVKEIKEHFETGINNIPTISDRLEKVVNKYYKRIIVFIDNLDRCSLENVLEILDTLKLFLGIKNFIFVIAVDISKIKLAWSYKYGKIDDFAKEGFKYLEKIFQIEKAIPVPTSEQVKEYVKILCPGCSDDLIEMISLTGSKNPRDIKRLLNLISLRANVRKEQSITSKIAVLWTVFEKLATALGTEYASNLYSQSGGSKQFYEFLELKDFSPDDNKTDEQNADHLIESISHDSEKRNSRSYPVLLYNETLVFGVQLKKRVGLYLIRSRRILSEMKENEDEVIKCTNDVVSFS
jgi:hypothetical protein